MKYKEYKKNIYESFRKMYIDKRERLKAQILACIFMCMPIWLLFGAEIGSRGRIAGILVLLFLAVFYGCGVVKMNTNLKQLRNIEAMERVKNMMEKMGL